MQTKSIFKNVEQINYIINNYHFWSTLSKLKNYPAMRSLTIPNSNFHDLTQACQKSHQSGINYSYEFEELKIVDLSKTKNEAIIKGIVIMEMSGSDIIYRGKFISTCCKRKPLLDWKLNDIEIDWI